MKNCSYRLLYSLWAALFALTAVLGLVFPQAQGGGKAALMLLSLVFFLPPWLILARAKAEGNLFHIRLVRYIALASILLTLVLLILNLRSAGLGEAMGAALNAALVIVSAPMVCSNFFVLPIFCWGTLIMGSFTKKN